MSHLTTLSLKDARSEMRDYGNLRSLLQGESTEEKIICPKPQRVAVATFRSTEFIKSICQLRSVSPAALDAGDAGCEILEIFSSKNIHGESPNFGCSPPYFSGSPPCRAPNPLVRDTQFLHAPACSSPRSAIKVAAGSPLRASPLVRIEGFECSGRGFECTGRDVGRRVPAFA